MTAVCRLIIDGLYLVFFCEAVGTQSSTSQLFGIFIYFCSYHCFIVTFHGE